MKIINRSLAALFLVAALTISAVPVVAASHASWFQGDNWGNIHGLVGRTQEDLRMASDIEHNSGKQRDRYRDAQQHLSDFDRGLSKGRFDKGALKHSLDNIESILNHNTLQARSRDALMRDITELKIARDRRG